MVTFSPDSNLNTPSFFKNDYGTLEVDGFNLRVRHRTYCIALLKFFGLVEDYTIGGKIYHFSSGSLSNQIRSFKHQLTRENIWKKLNGCRSDQLSSIGRQTTKLGIMLPQDKTTQKEQHPSVEIQSSCSPGKQGNQEITKELGAQGDLSKPPQSAILSDSVSIAADFDTHLNGSLPEILDHRWNYLKLKVNGVEKVYGEGRDSRADLVMLPTVNGVHNHEQFNMSIKVNDKRLMEHNIGYTKAIVDYYFNKGDDRYPEIIILGTGLGDQGRTARLPDDKQGAVPPLSKEDSDSITNINSSIKVISVNTNVAIKMYNALRAEGQTSVGAIFHMTC